MENGLRIILTGKPLEAHTPHLTITQVAGMEHKTTTWALGRLKLQSNSFSSLPADPQMLLMSLGNVLAGVSIEEAAGRYLLKLTKYFIDTPLPFGFHAIRNEDYYGYKHNSYLRRKVKIIDHNTLELFDSLRVGEKPKIKVEEIEVPRGNTDICGDLRPIIKRFVTDYILPTIRNEEKPISFQLPFLCPSMILVRGLIPLGTYESLFQVTIYDEADIEINFRFTGQLMKNVIQCHSLQQLEEVFKLLIAYKENEDRPLIDREDPQEWTRRYWRKEICLVTEDRE